MLERVYASRGTIDKRELTFKAMAGLIGAAIGWIPVELASHGHTLTEHESTPTIIAGFVAMALVSALIGGMIVAAQDNSFEITPAARRRFFRGFVICLVIAIPETYYSDVVFTSILRYGGWGVGQAGSEFYLIFARTVGWTLMGLMLGIGVGIASLSLQNVIKGAIGGWVGGFVGGIAFDIIGTISTSGLFSRLIGFCLIGVAIGFFIGLVQELTKAAWLAVEAGRLKGRQFRIEGSTAMIGRAEENPVGLFGDPGVQPRHAVIERSGDAYTIKNLAVQAGTMVNGNRIETTQLREGDQIRISNYELSFHTRGGVPAHVMAQPARPPAFPMAANGVASSTSVSDAAVARSPLTSNGPVLIAADGRRFALRADATTQIGRATDNDIVVSDASVSRHHAMIEARDGSFVLRDLGSQNGTWLHGSRIAEAAVANGDSLRFGDTVFTFNA